MRKRNKSKKEQTDTVDKLARQYIAKYFDGPAGKGKVATAAAGTGKAVAAAAAMKRWFE